MSDYRDPSIIWQEFRQELDTLKAENASLQKEVTDLKQQQPKYPEGVDAETMDALAELDADLAINSDQEGAKKQLLGLLDDLEEMIGSLNAGTGMGLKVPDKLNEIRNSLTA